MPLQEENSLAFSLQPSTSLSIGLDFDNTIVCYDQVFHNVACELQLIPKELLASKEIIRNYLREKKEERAWTLLQGTVYGTRMQEATPFPGLLAFLKKAKEAGITISIISHKTKTPYLGPAYDLHRAALTWMEHHGFFHEQHLGIIREKVFFETSQEKKLTRITKERCDFFIDDLPELLEHPLFPSQTKKILFSSIPTTLSKKNYFSAIHWNDIQQYFFCDGN